MTFATNVTNFTTNNTTEYLVRGQIVEAVFGTYDKLIGLSLFAMLIIGLLLVLVYLKTRSAGMVAVVSIVASGVVSAIPPVEMTALMMFAAAVTIGALLYGLFSRGGGGGG